MHARSSGSASAGVRGRLRLEWEVGLQRLPFFTQRLAVALLGLLVLGLLVVSLALVGGMVILWGGNRARTCSSGLGGVGPAGALAAGSARQPTSGSLLGPRALVGRSR